MAWTEITRRQYARRTARYASDMTDREWALVQPCLPMPRRLGRPRTTDLREVVNALLYIATTRCQWRMLPKDFPPCSTVQRYFYEWQAMGVWSRINHYLVMDVRELEGKEASPTAAMEVMRDFNLEIADHEFVVFLGPSGCGKSTMLRMIAGLEEITGGDLLIGGERMNDRDPGDRGIAMVFQNYALYPHMSVRENITFGLERAGVAKAAIDERLGPVIDALGLGVYLSRKPTELSGGQQQRVAIARAMNKTPDVFLFDEPLSNLDVKLRGSLRVEIARLHRDLKTTSIYVTHDQLEAMTLADRIVLMKDGKIEQMGTPEEIYQAPANLFVAGFIGTPNMNFLSLEASGGALGDSAIRLTAPFQLSQEPVIVGIRPGAFKLVDQGGAYRGRVERNEFHGETRLLTLRNDGHEINVALPASAHVNEGELVGLDVAAEDLHLFEPETGRRLIGPE